MFFCIRVSIFRKEFFVKNGMCRAENNISLYIVYETIAIILISNEYHQFRTWHKFIDMKFVGGKHILYSQKHRSMMFWVFYLRKSSEIFSILRHLTDVWLYKIKNKMKINKVYYLQLWQSDPFSQLAQNPIVSPWYLQSTLNPTESVQCLTASKNPVTSP